MTIVSYSAGIGVDGKPTQQTNAYYLASTTDLVRFYCFEEPTEDGSADKFTLLDQFDRGRLLGAGDKATAKLWAKRLGLRSWTYVRI